MNTYNIASMVEQISQSDVALFWQDKPILELFIGKSLKFITKLIFAKCLWHVFGDTIEST